MIIAESFLPHMNGVTNSVLRSSSHLVRTGHTVQVIAPLFQGEQEHEMLDNGVEVIRLPGFSLPQYPAIKVMFGTKSRLAQLMKIFEPDVVHLASPFVLGWRALNAANQLGIPSVAVYQTHVPAYAQRYGVPELAGFLEQHVMFLHQKADLTLAPSHDSLRQLQAMGVPRLKLWRRGVDAELFNPAKRSTARRQELGATANTLLIGYVGRLASEKQVEDLAALSKLQGAQLVITGEGPLEQRLRELIPSARFTGFLAGEALAETVASLDVFVHTGEHETFCQTVQEALASGVPVVSTGAGGPLELVDHGRTGWLYEPGNLHDFAARVQDLLTDPAKREFFGVSARDSIRGRSWESVGDQLLEHYQSVITQKKVKAREAG